MWLCKEVAQWGKMTCVSVQVRSAMAPQGDSPRGNPSTVTSREMPSLNLLIWKIVLLS